MEARAIRHACVTFAARLAALLLFLGTVGDAAAHFRGLTDTAVEIAQPGLRIHYTLPADDLLELPGVAPGLQPPKAYIDEIAAGWSVEAEDARCGRAESSALALEAIEAARFVLTWRCDSLPDAVTLRYRLFSGPEQTHENLTRVFLADRRMNWRFSRANDSLRIDVAELLRTWDAPPAESFLAYDPNRDLGRAVAEADETDGPVRSGTAPGSAADWQAHPRFFLLGIEHILTGPDHVAMVVAIAMVPATVRRLVLWVSTFTLAHSITLALAFFEVLRLPPTTTEPLVAATVAAVGIENLWILCRGPSALGTRTALILVFGLIHGIGLSYQLSAAAAVAAGAPLGRLLLFNVGVEVGQLVILAATLVPLRAWYRSAAPPYPQIAASLVIAVAGGLWLLWRWPA